ncbi:MAG: phytanoyl-CoA dioxygenase family protein [Lautropia sp.]
MNLSAEQLRRYDADGFLILPGLLSPAEVEVLRLETRRLSELESDLIKRERNGAVRSIFRSHEADGATTSEAFHALARIPRMLGPATQLLRDRQLYIFHSKINVKPAFEGTIWAWHQDYGTWEKDGVPTSNMTTALVMLDQAEEIGGALYFIPGSHQRGNLEHIEDRGVGALNQYSVRRDLLRSVLESRRPVPVIGPPGTVAFFHAQIVHGSGHNMSAGDRRQAYLVYNAVANKSLPVPNPRGDHVRSQNFAPLRSMDDAAILAAGARLPHETVKA